LCPARGRGGSTWVEERLLYNGVGRNIASVKIEEINTSKVYKQVLITNYLKMI